MTTTTAHEDLLTALRANGHDVELWADDPDLLRAYAQAINFAPAAAPAVKLTPAARRDLALLQAGERVDLRFGPYEQLLAAGYIEGSQDDYRLVVR